MNRPIVTVFALLVIGALLAGCGATPAPISTPEPTALPTPPPPTGGTIHGTAQVDEIEISILESFPVQVAVTARGYLPDGCTSIDTVTQERTGQEIRVTITTTRPADAMCTQALIPFQQAFSVDVLGLPAGTYTVNVNGVSDIFELAVDNVSPTEPTPTTGLQGGILATFDVNGEQFQVWVTNPETVQQILDLAAGASSAKFPNGRILRGPGPVDFNSPWSWHLDPGDIEMSEMTTEVCDGTPSYVEEHLDEFVDTVGRYCPWSARLVDVQDLSGGTGQTGDGPVLTWHREGGIAGFCDELTVYASGDVYARSCKESQPGELRHTRLTAGQTDQIAAWADRFQSFEIEETDPATADAMTIRLTFAGTGTAPAGNAEKQDMLDLAAELYAGMSNPL
jgi:hypothetical protein